MGIGQPSYATPQPVKRGDGTQIIWDWHTRDWLPYTPPDPAKGPEPGAPAGTPDARSDGAPEGPTPGPEAAPDGGPSADRSPAGPSLEQRRRRTAGGRAYAPGSTLLTMWGDF